MSVLSDLQAGESGTIKGYGASASSYRAKLLSMGLTTGTPFTVVRYAPMGDPIEIEIRGYRLSLRKAEAAVINVETNAKGKSA